MMQTKFQQDASFLHPHYKSGILPNALFELFNSQQTGKIIVLILQVGELKHHQS